MLALVTSMYFEENLGNLKLPHNKRKKSIKKEKIKKGRKEGKTDGKKKEGKKEERREREKERYFDCCISNFKKSNQDDKHFPL